MIFGEGETKSAKASSFLSSLRREPQAGGAAASPEAVRPLLARIEMLERRLQEMAQKAEAEKPPEDAPPQPPSELMMFLQTRLQLLESKLQTAQEEALRANLLLREREEAQRKAQTEVEQLFRSIREQSRAASWDAKLRDEFAASRNRIKELEARLAEMQLKSMPAEEILRAINTDEGRAELEKRLNEQLERAARLASSAGEERGGEESIGVAGADAPAPPRFEQSPFEAKLSPASGEAAAATAVEAEAAVDTGTLAVVMGRLADLEKSLQEAHEERDNEKARRILWEKDILAAISKEPAQWQRSGGAQLVVESALEHLAQSFKERDAAAAEMAGIVKQIQQEPPDSSELLSLRARLAVAQDKVQQLQQSLDKHMNIVQAWLKSGKK